MVLYEMKMYKAHVDVSSADNMETEKIWVAGSLQIWRYVASF